MRTIKSLTLLVLIFILISSGVLAPLGRYQATQSAYVEPGLDSQAGGSLPVIISAHDSSTAARAVASIGGEVTSDLWLINAVAAVIPAGQLQALAAYPGISSIVDNKRVSTAGEPDSDGWVTNRRAKKDSHPLEGKQDTPAVFLPAEAISLRQRMANT